MSHCPIHDPSRVMPNPPNSIETVIVPRARDLGGFEVRRALPAAQRQMVGPFIFFDQMGPAEFLIGHGIDVRPHPHIGLATVTYLFEGEIMHRDSLGTAVAIRPGEVNLMTAGRGIVHSERDRGRAARRAVARLFGIQAWAALPATHEERAPAFVHHGSGRAAAHRRRGQARARGDGRALRRRLAGRPSRIRACSPRRCWRRARVLPLDPDYDERAVYVVSGEIDIAGDTFAAGPAAGVQAGDRISDPGGLASRA